VTSPPASPPPILPEGEILCVCRHPALQAAVRQYIGPCRICSSGAEVVLQAVRVPPQAVIIECQDGDSSPRQVLAALKRSLPNVPVYAIALPENEPLAAQLRGAGLADYFVLPDDVRRLPSVLGGRKLPTPTVAAPAEDADTARLARRFDAACRLAALALEQPTPLFCDGARLIFKAMGTAHGCAFWWSPEVGRLDLAVIVGGSESLGADDPEMVRAAASRSLRTGEVLVLPAGSEGAPPNGLLCVPVRQASAVYGVLCLPARINGWLLSDADRQTAETLARALACLVAGALRRAEYARLALRDAETGLLQADPFRTYLESRVAYARDCGKELALVLIETEPSPRAGTGADPGRAGWAIREALAPGWEGGRLAESRYAVAIGAAEPGASGEADTHTTVAQAAEAAARRLAWAVSQAHPSARLRIAVVRFPADGPTPESLLAEAEQRLAAASRPGV